MELKVKCKTCTRTMRPKLLNLISVSEAKSKKIIVAPAEWKVSPSLSGYLPVLFAGPHLYSWVKRDTVTLKNLASEHTSITWPELEPRPPDLEFSAQKSRPQSFTKSKVTLTYV